MNPNQNHNPTSDFDPNKRIAAICDSCRTLIKFPTPLPPLAELFAYFERAIQHLQQNRFRSPYSQEAYDNETRIEYLQTRLLNLKALLPPTPSAPSVCSVVSVLNPSNSSSPEAQFPTPTPLSQTSQKSQSSHSSSTQSAKSAPSPVSPPMPPPATQPNPQSKNPPTPQNQVHKPAENPQTTPTSADLIPISAPQTHKTAPETATPSTTPAPTPLPFGPPPDIFDLFFHSLYTDPPIPPNLPPITNAISNRPNTAPKRGPLGVLNQLPLEIQEQIFDLLEDHTYDQVAAHLAKPETEGGLNLKVNADILGRFYRRRTRLKTHDDLAEITQAARDLINHARHNPDLDVTPIANHIIKLRVLDGCLSPDTTIQTLHKLQQTLNRIRQTDLAERRLNLAQTKQPKTTATPCNT